MCRHADPGGRRRARLLLKDQNNQDVRLADFHGRKAVLLVFYPLTFTGTCRGELAAIQADLPRSPTTGAGAGGQRRLGRTATRCGPIDQGFDFPLLADFWPHGAVAEAYGVFNEDGGFANRGTFLIDAAGVVRFAEMAGPGESRDQEVWLAAIDRVAG